MMKIKEYRNNTPKLIVSGNNKNTNLENKETNRINNSRQESVKVPEVCLGDTLMNPPQIDPFFTMMLINNKLVRNCMIDSGVAINIIPMGVMKQLGMWVDTNGGKCYAIDSRPVLVVGIMKDLELKLVAYPHIVNTIDITVIYTPPHFGMLSSRQWIVSMGGNVNLIYLTLKFQ
jgi:hypothetical protein